MRIVAVSQRVDVISDRKETRDALDQRLTEFLLSAGCLPVPVPNCLAAGLSGGENGRSVLADWLATVRAGAIVLSGGNDFGQSSSRDKTEAMLLDLACDKGIPVLGICRGLQMMSRWAGTALKQVDGHVRVRHHLTGQITAEVNSYHNYSPAYCPTGFSTLACSEDGEIEAIRHVSLPWEGWMWHPEREQSFSPHDLQRARDLLGANSA